jgi:putative SOS response-associated peptidase YedK
MCSRFENKESGISIFEKLRKDIKGSFILNDNNDELRQINIAPTDKTLTLFNDKNNIIIKTSKWGIRFDKDKKSPFIFNSRIETIKEKRYWTQLFYKNRCLIPATAYYEWKEINKIKIPHMISLSEEDFFFIPSIFVLLDNTIYTSMITTLPNKFVKSVHNRMPVILDKFKGIEFLNANPEQALNFCTPLDDKINMKIDIAEELLTKEC